MSQRVNAEGHMVEHYSALGDLKSDFRNQNLYNLVADLVKGERVVDIGCGAGVFLGVLKARGKKVSGVEPSSGMRELARRIDPEISISAELDQSEKVDTVVMLDVLEHIEDDAVQVQEVRSVLKEEGQFIVVVPAHSLLYGKRDRQMGHYRRHSKASIKKVLAENGFKVESLRHWNALGFLPYLISEKVLHRPLESKLRQNVNRGTLSAFLQHLLNLWFSKIENNFDFGFGLSIIGVAKKQS